MCAPASFIVTRDRVLWHESEDKHEAIIAKYKLRDDGVTPDFVRVEIAPPDYKYLLPYDQWVFKTDQDRLPDWYSAKHAEAECREKLPAWAKTRPWFFEAMRFVDTIKDVQWFKPTKPPLKKWMVFPARAAARAAARDAALDAAWVAAWDAARVASVNAAGGAAMDAAMAAIGDAARDAALDADLLARCLIVANKIDTKHLDHAKARWDVWVRGYGLLCDVDGKMYVYRKQ